MAYWGSEREKAELHTLFLSPNYTYRTAALHAVALLRDASQEQAALDSYDQQPESVRREVLRVRELEEDVYRSAHVVFEIRGGLHAEAR